MASAPYSVRGRIAVITLDNPPVNGLGHALRNAIAEGVKRAEADASVKAIVLIGAGNAFCGGADIREFNTPKALQPPTTRDVISFIEASPKPVIAAIHKVAMGGGLELAMGCHYRVASPKAAIALPEVKLGILPGAGGTQRLPRAIPVERALAMITTGEPMMSEAIAPLGLIDEMISGDLLEGTVKFAERVVAEAKPLRKLRDVMPRASEELFATARKKIAAEMRGFPAPIKCVEAVEAAVKLPFDEGLKFERKCFEELVATTESKALRHAFFAERAASKIPDVPEDTPTIDVKRVAIVGAGTMGGGIAMAFVNAGIPVRIIEAKQEALDRGMKTIKANYDATVSKGRLAQEAMDQRVSLIQPTLSYRDLADCDMVIEAVFEEMSVKKAVFKTLDEVMKPGAILATNTSTLDVNEIASAVKRPESVIGTHFFSPANVMRLLEIVRGAKTSKSVLATVMQLSKRIKKVGVVSGVCDGFIGNRMLEEYARQAYFMLEEGALPQDIDRVLQEWGMAMGPFTMLDMAGGDIGWAIRKRRAAEPGHKPYSKIPDRICELGRFGQKTGAGFYKYEPGNRKPIVDPLVDRLVADFSKELGLARRKIDDREIVERTIFALVNEGAKILEEGIAIRGSDIDLVYLTGYGFPLYRGGPMFYADTLGLGYVVERMREYAKAPSIQFGEFWQPASLLAKLAAEGKRFNS